MIKLLFIINLLVLPASAYLDPGTGSMLLYFVMGVFATIAYSIKGFYYKIKAFITGGKIDKSLRNLEGIDILFYSESGNYWNVFLPIIEELEIKGVKSAYYTSSEDDPGLNSNFEHSSVRFIGSDVSSFTLLNQIDVKVVIMTTPQLDVMYLKRSKLVKHYVHLIHAPTDALIYKKFAFDYFDSVMCSGTHQIESIRELEKVRKLPQKVLYETGLTYYDVMYRNRKKYMQEEKEKVVLIAPTWGENGMLSKFGISPIEILLKANYRVILRPHPQVFISQKELIEDIINKLSKYENLEIDRKSSPEESMGRANVMISDISGIIFDFCFIYEKPIIIVEDEIKKGGLEAEDVEKEIWETEMFNKVATLINFKNIKTLPDIVLNTINNNVTNNVTNLREASLFNFSNAGNIAANQILEIIGDKR